MPRPRSEEKEQALIQAAIELFLQQGVCKTTIKDIAEKAEVAVGTVYVYYKDKVQVIRKVAYAFADQHHALAEGVLHSKRKPLGKLNAYLLGLYDMWLPFGENSMASIEIAAAVIKFAPETLNIAKEEFLTTTERILQEGRNDGLNVASAKTEARWISVATSPFFPLAGTPEQHPFTAHLSRDDFVGFIKWLERKLKG